MEESLSELATSRTLTESAGPPNTDPRPSKNSCRVTRIYRGLDDWDRVWKYIVVEPNQYRGLNDGKTGSKWYTIES